MTPERSDFVAAIRQNIETADRLFRDGGPPGLIGTVCGSAAAQSFWQRRLDQIRPELRARLAVSLHEDLPVNQAFGLLLMWQRLRPQLRPGEGALVAFVFGEGSRATPITEAEGGQKPAIASFVKGAGDRWRSVVELALRTFAPVESLLRRSGFDGVVVKWGDEIQIPTRDLSTPDPRFATADVVRFVSVQPIEPSAAANKDWVGVDESGNVTAFIPRRPIEQMEKLADRGLLLRRNGRLFGGVNLGSIALSRPLLDLLLEEFEHEVNDPTADRTARPDLDPQLFTALTIARIDDETERAAAWRLACEESPAIDQLATKMPAVLTRLRTVLETYTARHARPARFVALDFGDQYWGDIGQHAQMFDLYASVRSEGATGEISRALAGLDDVHPDANGNRLVGSTHLGPDVRVRNSVLIDVSVETGQLDGVVLLGTQAGRLIASDAFDVLSTVADLTLAPRAGSYRVVSSTPVRAEAGERVTSVFLDEANEPLLLRVHEQTDLRDRATTYDKPVLGNAVAFREAHERVLAADPSALERTRTVAEKRVREQIGALRGR